MKKTGWKTERPREATSIADIRSYPGFPVRGRVYVVGDVHGRADLLAGIHAAIDQDRAQAGTGSFGDFDFEVYLGDYVDRGPQANRTIARLIERSQQVHCTFLRGNHEDIFSRVLAGEETVERWVRMGGADTICSYGLDPSALLRTNVVDAMAALRAAVPQSHQMFLQQLSHSLWLPPYFFVHAGVRPGIPLDQQNAEDLMWVRQPFLLSDADFGALVVHGHTPSESIVFRGNRIGLDTGAYATNRLGCLRIDDQGVSVIAPRP